MMTLIIDAGRQQAEANLRDVRLHMEWQESRMADLESQDAAQTARRYDAELQRMKQQLQQERQKLQGQLLQEKRAREAAEQQLANAVASSQQVMMLLYLYAQCCISFTCPARG